MSASQLFLIIISALGVVHGLFLAVFLWSYRQGSTHANRLLSLLLIVLSFRVGKSLFLEFTQDLDVKFIFVGLGTMMIIGPLYYFYVMACLDKSFRVTARHLVHFIPSIAGIIFGLWIDESDLKILPRLLFAFLFIAYYLHYLTYVFLGFHRIRKLKNDTSIREITKWLLTMFVGLGVIWLAYVLNLFDEQIPYVIGPVLYSIVAYSLSLIAIRKGYLQKIGNTKYHTTSVSEEQVNRLFQKVSQVIVDEKQYLNPALTLKSLSARMNVSTQVLSMVINQKGDMNYNSFINHHRIGEAIRLLNNEKSNNLTIAAIAFEVGFNSLSSFNAAFKKRTGETPKAYREALLK